MLAEEARGRLCCMVSVCVRVSVMLQWCSSNGACLPYLLPPKENSAEYFLGVVPLLEALSIQTSSEGGIRYSFGMGVDGGGR